MEASSVRVAEDLPLIYDSDFRGPELLPQAFHDLLVFIELYIYSKYSF